MSEPVAPAALDRKALLDLLEMTGGDAAFLTELIDTFLADGPTLVADMQTARKSSDLVTLRRVAHTLKSNSRTFGATALGDLCSAIEERAAAGNLDGVDGLVAQAAAEYPAVEVALLAERTDA
jgi:HPt (histidine-containing phosphotransfer) domain-containing protein